MTSTMSPKGSHSQCKEGLERTRRAHGISVDTEGPGFWQKDFWGRGEMSSTNADLFTFTVKAGKTLTSE